MKVVLSTYPGSFRLPNTAKYWLLSDREALHLFGKSSIKDSNFALNVVQNKIEAETGFAGKFDENWGYFNSNIVSLNNWHFYGLAFGIKSGAQCRSDKNIVKAVEKFDIDDLKIVDVKSDNFKIETARNGEFLVNTEHYYEENI